MKFLKNNFAKQFSGNFKIETEKHTEKEQKEIEKEIKKKSYNKVVSEEIEGYKLSMKKTKASVDSDNYVVLIFTNSEDKKEFMLSAKIDDNLYDGYQFAKEHGFTPTKPKFKMRDPF